MTICLSVFQNTAYPWNNWVIQPGVLGKLIVGMDWDKAVNKALYQGNIVVINKTENGQEIPVGVVKRRGHIFLVMEPVKGVLASIEIKSPDYKTEQGLGLGSGWEEVQQKNPDVKKEMIDGKTCAHILGPDGKIIFCMEGDQVNKVFITAK